MIWELGNPWPGPKNWKYRAPTFPGCLGGPVDLVEIWDEAEFERIGYQTSGIGRPNVPDFLGRTRGGEWILYESKSDDHLDDAVQQLSDGLAEFVRLNRKVDKLGIVLNQINSNEDFFVMKAGRLLGSRLIPAGTPIYLGDEETMPIMIELRG